MEMELSSDDFMNRIPLLKDPDHFGFSIKLLNEKPAIVHIHNLLNPVECQHIINLARPKLTSSTMIVNNVETVNPSRSSSSAFLTQNGELPTNDAIIHRFLSRLSKFTGYPVSHFEGMKVVNYKKSQQYLAHYDFFREHTNFTKESGDRQFTFFVYLNTLPEEAGGYTAFPNLNLKVKPSLGDAVFWTNMDFAGKYYEETLHAGEPVLTDVEKWGINVWIREKSYQK